MRRFGDEARALDARLGTMPPAEAALAVVDLMARVLVDASRTCCQVDESEIELLFDVLFIASVWLDQKLSTADKTKRTADRVKRRGGVGSRLWNELSPDEQALLVGELSPDELIGSGVADTLADWLTKIREAITNAIDGVAQWVNDTVDHVTSGIADAVGNATDSLVGMWDRVTDSVAEFFTNLGVWFDDLLSRLGAAIETAVDSIADAVAGMVESATEFIGAAIDAVVEFIGDAIDTIKSTAESLYAGAVELADRIAESFQSLIDATVGAAGDAFAALAETVGDIPKTLRELSEGAAKSIEELIGRPLADLPGAIPDAIANMLRGAIEGDEKSLDDAVRLATLGETHVATTREQFRDLFTKTLPTSPVLRFAANMFLGIFVLMKIGGGIADAQAQIILQEYALSTPFQLLAPADAIRAERFNLLDRRELTETIRKQGYSEADAGRMIAAAEVLPEAGEMLSWWLRGLMTDKELDDALLKHGIGAANISRLRDAAFFIPPPQDLITMAVREAFTPETAEKFGQYEDFPPEFAAHAKTQGISEEWARRYWAAHWGLPSPMQGFEMLHRRVIDKPTLEMLLKALDVMPFWRDKLIAISYNPITRVDIRRMHALGVLDDEGVRNAFMDIGYSPENADKLLQFTKKLNDPKIAPDDTELDTLTRSQVLNFYDDGVLDRGRAQSLMAALGVPTETIKLHLDAVDLADERRERAAEIGLIIERAKAGAIDFDEAQDELNALGLEEREKTKALTQLMRAEKSKTRQPSRDELKTFFAAGLLQKDELRRELSRLGYARRWVDLYIELWTQPA